MQDKIHTELLRRRENERQSYGGFLNKKDADKNEMKSVGKADEANREVAQKLVKGLGSLYDDVDKAMEPAREKERELRQQLELEKDLMGVIDESKGKKAPETFDKFMSQREKRFEEQEDQLDQKKKVLDKLDRERTWEEDETWKENLLNFRDRPRQSACDGWD